MNEKDRVKIKIMDEILQGRDIKLEITFPTPEITRWVIVATALRKSSTLPPDYDGTFSVTLIELFSWTGKTTPIYQIYWPLTLKDALALVEKHWENRDIEESA
jgi:hypothetical protein